MLYYFQMYSKVIPLYKYPILFQILSHLGYYRILSRVSYAIQYVLVGYLLKYSNMYISVSNSQSILPPILPPAPSTTRLFSKSLSLFLFYK